jgi:4-amino-4-deoxy-L-arabinose transferase-like glycosyltransferase
VSNAREPDGSPGHARARWLLIALAVVVRVAFRVESAQLPFMHVPMFDSAVYLAQADAIRAGRFGDPTLLAFGPLYGWFLAATGPLVIDVQLALGLLTTLAIERAASRFSQAAALACLAVWIGYAIPLFYETLLMSETLGLFVVACGVAVFLDERCERGDRRVGLLAGALLGLATLARANLLFALPFFVATSIVRRGEEPTKAPRDRTITITLGIALVLGANGLWNFAHVGRFIPVILASRTASLASAHGEWTGTLAPLSASGAPPSAWDVVHQAEATLASDAPAPLPTIDLAGWLASSPSKLAQTFSDVETTFDYGFYGERTELRALAWEPVSMGTLLVLGLLGAIVLVRTRGWRSLVPHLPLILGTLIVTTLFHPSTRYRLAMAIPLVLLSSFAVAELFRMHGRRRAVAIGCVGLVVVALGVRHLTHPLASPGMWELRVAEGEAARGDVDAARARIVRAREVGGDGVEERIEVLRAAHALPPPPP